ncbi:hypothetical protein ACFLU5_00155 [Bacteroidota bacterium]
MDIGIKDMGNCRYTKLFFAFIGFVLITGPSFAQKGFWYGSSIGVQNTYLTSLGRSEIDTKNAIRPLMTIDIEYRVSPKVAIQSGIGYSLYTQNTSKFKNNFNYFTIPLYIKGGSFKNDRKYALSFFGGFNLNYLLSAQNIYQGERKDISDYTTDFLIYNVVGFGVKRKINDNFVIETHLIGSMGGLLNNASTDGFLLMNMNYGLTVGLKYNFREK